MDQPRYRPVLNQPAVNSAETPRQLSRPFGFRTQRIGSDVFTPRNSNNPHNYNRDLRRAWSSNPQSRVNPNQYRDTSEHNFNFRENAQNNATEQFSKVENPNLLKDTTSHDFVHNNQSVEQPLDEWDGPVGFNSGTNLQNNMINFSPKQFDPNSSQSTLKVSKEMPEDFLRLPTTAEELPTAALAPEVLEAADAAAVASAAADVAMSADPLVLPLIFAAQAANEAIKASAQETFSKELGADRMQYDKNLTSSGQFGNSMQAELHAKMLFDAQQQTNTEKSNMLNVISPLLGPLGTFFASNDIDSHVSDAEKNINFNTAFSNTGTMVNPDDYAQIQQNGNPPI